MKNYMKAKKDIGLVRGSMSHIDISSESILLGEPKANLALRERRYRETKESAYRLLRDARRALDHNELDAAKVKAKLFLGEIHQLRTISREFLGSKDTGRYGTARKVV